MGGEDEKKLKDGNDHKAHFKDQEKKTLSTEDVVNIVGDKPSALFVITMVGLMAFNTMCALVAYFPNFGGYVPYTEWRCNTTSELCYSRINNFSDIGWTEVSNANNVFLDSRCSVKIREMNTTEAKLILMGSAKNIIGVVSLQMSENLVIITSNSSCTADTPEKCTSKLTVKFGGIKNQNSLVHFGSDANMICELTFSGTKTDSSTNTLTCDGVGEVNLDESGSVFSLNNAINDIRYVSLTGIGEYDLYCPREEKYNKENLCGSDDEKEMKQGTDFYWFTHGRSSFSADWNLQCGGEFLRTMIGSVYFGGALIGTSMGGTLYDVIGRKKGALVGYGIVIVSTFASAASPSIEFLFVCRFFQGLGVFVGFTGMFVLLLEYTPSKYRCSVNSSVLFFWAVGYLLTTLTAYLIKSWHWLASIAAFLFVLSLIPLIVTAESPRYLLVNKKDTKAAKLSLSWLIRMNRANFDIDKVTLQDISEKEEESGFLETLKDFIRYKELTIQLVVQMWMWMVAGFLYYGFSFSWSELGDNIYLSYLYAAIGEVLAYVGMVFPIEYFGRKVSNIMFYLVGSASFLVALIPYKLGDAITVEQLSCLVGSMFVAAAFGSIYLYTIELAPTSHRGKMLGYCSFAARIGSFCGPQASLLFGWNKTWTLILFATLAGLAGLANFRLPKTKGVATPNTAEEVQLRKGRSYISDDNIHGNPAAN